MVENHSFSLKKNIKTNKKRRKKLKKSFFSRKMTQMQLFLCWDCFKIES